MNFYISDLHLFHNKIMTLANRPFADVEEMHKVIVKNWNQAVGKKDTVYVLGDVGFYHVDEIAEILHSLHGQKILIIGNHDRQNIRKETFRKCFKEITPYKEIKDEGKTLVLFHYPIEEWDGFFRDFYHLHGHVHNKDDRLLSLPNRFNVSADVLGFRPRTLKELVGKREWE